MLIPLLVVVAWLWLTALVLACCVAAARGDTTTLLPSAASAGPGSDR